MTRCCSVFSRTCICAENDSNTTSCSPTESTEPLLRVNYNFYWQLSYRLAEPLPLKAGTVLQAVAWYDNSKNNPHNPDPDAAVRWGDQTYDEMMVGFFDVAVPRGSGQAPLLHSPKHFAGAIALKPSPNLSRPIPINFCLQSCDSQHLRRFRV